MFNCEQDPDIFCLPGAQSLVGRQVNCKQHGMANTRRITRGCGNTKEVHLPQIWGGGGGHVREDFGG